jgi:predicted PurR-regulated permease PerM
MTVLVACSVVLPALWLLVLLQEERVAAYRSLAAFIARGPHVLPPSIREVPWLGEQAQAALDRYSADPSALGREVSGWFQRWAGAPTVVLGDVGRNLAKLLLTLITLFFFYRDGDTIIRQATHVVRRAFGSRLDGYILTAGAMTRAVLYGLLITAIAQGILSGIGYWLVGLRAPVLLGELTAVLSTVPLVGTAIVWVPIGAWLLLAGETWKGIALLVWGVLLVHPIDNILRPLLISNVAHVPLLLVMFGAIGGVAAFGLVGLFVGPVLLGVAMAVWREWAGPETAEDPA